MQQGVQFTIVGVGGTYARYDLTHTMPDQFTQTEADAIRDFLVDLVETKYSASGYSGSAARLNWV